MFCGNNVQDKDFIFVQNCRFFFRQISIYEEYNNKKTSGVLKGMCHFDLRVKLLTNDQTDMKS